MKYLHVICSLLIGFTLGYLSSLVDRPREVTQRRDVKTVALEDLHQAFLNDGEHATSRYVGRELDVYLTVRGVGEAGDNLLIFGAVPADSRQRGAVFRVAWDDKRSFANVVPGHRILVSGVCEQPQWVEGYAGGLQLTFSSCRFSRAADKWE